ncbi:MAG TPA: hypothetical protein VK401_10355 [Propionibacteriaceae bacterium]|jgi:hypothetical protein|nr:hypothetical protein [Propionibacteriaceae bacterium]
MTESSFGGDNDVTAGATVESSETADSAADREAGFDDSVSSASGTVTDDDALVASAPNDSAADETALDSARDTSYDADLAAGQGD